MLTPIVTTNKNNQKPAFSFYLLLCLVLLVLVLTMKIVLICILLLFQGNVLDGHIIGAEAALPHRSEYLVEGLHHAPSARAFADFDGSMYAGLIPFDSDGDRHGNLMFWLFLPTAPTNPNSLVLWLNGGPGCSSFDAGIVFENGPVKVPSRPAGYCCTSPTDPLETNPYSWTRVTPMLYLEQPAGTGFSDGPEPQDEDDLAGDVHSFLQNFFTIFQDEELHNKQFYIMGESYAGMFVPSIAYKIHMKNQDDTATSSDIKHINLAGIAIGNAWMDGRIQGSTVIDYAFWHGMIDMPTRTLLHQEWQKCVVRGTRMASPLHTYTTPDECGIMDAVLQASGKGLMPQRNPNTYDVTTWDTYPVLDSDDTHTTFALFFNDDLVKEALHAPVDVEWRGCIPGAGRRRRRLALLDNDRPLSVAPYLAQLMDDAKIRVLVYSGDRDMSTNSAGAELVLNDMTEWSGHDTWQAQTRGLWVDSKQEMAGWSKEFDRLSFLVVYNSGHLVPFNQPARSLELLERFLSNTTFMDLEIPRLEFTNLSIEDAWRDSSTGVRTGLIVMILTVTMLSGFGLYSIVARVGGRYQYSKLPSNT